MQHVGRPITSKFRPLFTENIKSLQFCKLSRKGEENAAIECSYQEIDRQLKGQFIHRLNDMEMLEEIIPQLSVQY